MDKVICPLCGRSISLDTLGATNLAGEPVMDWHLVDKDFAHFGQCKGSHLSVADAQSKKEEGKPARANAGGNYVRVGASGYNKRCEKTRYCGGSLAVADVRGENDNYESNHELQVANGHLIAAAPELLDALYAIHNAFLAGEIKWKNPRQSDSDPYHPANIKMSAAIAKAEGR